MGIQDHPFPLLAQSTHELRTEMERLEGLEQQAIADRETIADLRGAIDAKQEECNRLGARIKRQEEELTLLLKALAYEWDHSSEPPSKVELVQLHELVSTRLFKEKP